jgi:hypothetical protein
MERAGDMTSPERNPSGAANRSSDLMRAFLGRKRAANAGTTRRCVSITKKSGGINRLFRAVLPGEIIWKRNRCQEDGSAVRFAVSRVRARNKGVRLSTLVREMVLWAGMEYQEQKQLAYGIALREEMGLDILHGVQCI